MKRYPEIPLQSTGLLSVLSLSPLEEDHESLEAIIGCTRWRLHEAHQVSTAREFLETHEVSVIVCERDLEPGTWIDLLETIRNMPHPPSLVVTSRLADDRLWAEALNLGAWDVLAKPFIRNEVLRTVKAAWEHWRRQAELNGQALRAAS